MPTEAWVSERTADAQERLQESASGRLLWSAIEAHGGLSTWFSAGPIEFRFTYIPIGRDAIDTVQLVDTWSSRARHWRPDEPDVGFGWDGERAWQIGEGDDLPNNPRFWSLTPYYFVAIPWVLADPGVVLAQMGEAELDGRTYDLVRASFEANVGDAPDDYYIVYIDRETRRVGGLRYVVTYPGFFPDGGGAPEKLMTYDGEQVVDGLVFPVSYRSFRWDDRAAGDLVTNTLLRDLRFRPEAVEADVLAPDGAETVEGY
jgi:hypothetical protein